MHALRTESIYKPHLGTRRKLSSLSVLKQAFQVAFTVKNRDDSKWPFVDAVDDQIRKDIPKAKLLTGTEVFPTMPLSRCPNQRVKLT